MILEDDMFQVEAGGLYSSSSVTALPLAGGSTGAGVLRKNLFTPFTNRFTVEAGGVGRGLDKTEASLAVVSPFSDALLLIEDEEPAPNEVALLQ